MICERGSLTWVEDQLKEPSFSSRSPLFRQESPSHNLLLLLIFLLWTMVCERGSSTWVEDQLEEPSFSGRSPLFRQESYSYNHYPYFLFGQWITGDSDSILHSLVMSNTLTCFDANMNLMENVNAIFNLNFTYSSTTKVGIYPKEMKQSWISQTNDESHLLVYNTSKWFLTYHITMGIIVTSDKCVLTSAYDFCAANLEALPPNNLGIVQAIFVLSTRIGVMVVVTSFGSPCFNCITWFPIFATSPEEIFAVVAVGMNQSTISLALVCPPRSVIG